jgi:hypothetical protein
VWTVGFGVVCTGEAGGADFPAAALALAPELITAVVVTPALLLLFTTVWLAWLLFYP